MKMVKVARVGSKVQEVAVQTGATIAQCLEAAGIRKDPTEDVYENHVIKNIECTAIANSIIIVEPRKVNPMSSRLIKLIDFLADEDIINYYDVEDDDDESYLAYHEMYNDNKELIDSIISRAKEA